jgi:hypothetical protein
MNRPEHIVTAKKTPAHGRGKSSLWQPLENILVCKCHASEFVNIAHCFGDAACSGSTTPTKNGAKKTR